MTHRYDVFVVACFALVLCGAERDPDVREGDQNIITTIETARATLRCSIVGEVSLGGSVPIELCFKNNRHREVVFHSDIDDTVPFIVSIRDPDGKVKEIRIADQAGETIREGNGIANLRAERKLYAKTTLGPLTGVAFEKPGVYYVTISRDFNGVILFPLQPLRLVDVPVRVVADAKAVGAKKSGRDGHG